MELIKPIIFATFVSTLFLFNSIIVESQEVRNQTEFNYDEGSEHGPERWGLINKEWATCSKGRLQSPIDITSENSKMNQGFGRLRRAYRPSKATVINRGHDIMLDFEDGAGVLWINGTQYTLRQLHWHTPSEHNLNGHSYVLELHMVHISANKKIAVIAILYRIEDLDPFLAKLEKFILAVENRKEHEQSAGVIDPRVLWSTNEKYYRYIGSLTTPPCSEGVVWTVLSKVRPVFWEQVVLLRQAVVDGSELNARPQQPINNRPVEFYQPE